MCVFGDVGPVNSMTRVFSALYDTRNCISCPSACVCTIIVIVIIIVHNSYNNNKQYDWYDAYCSGVPTVRSPLSRLSAASGFWSGADGARLYPGLDFR